MTRENILLSFEPEFYKELIGHLSQTVVLWKRDANNFIPISCSQEFAEMMEGTKDEYLDAETNTPLVTVFPNDREKIISLFQKKGSKDGKDHIIVRKLTLKKKLIWVDIHFAFFTYKGEDYVYATYFDLRQLKEHERLNTPFYDDKNRELQPVPKYSLTTIRSNLTDRIVEEVTGTDLYLCDRVNAKIKTIFNERIKNMPHAQDRELYLKRFNFDRCQELYEEGQTPESMVILTRRHFGGLCFVRYSAEMSHNPRSGKITIFLIEEEFTFGKVSEVLRNKILSKQYDMICYIIDGHYNVAIGGESEMGRGNLFPKILYGDYEEYLNEVVIPALSPEVHDKESLFNELSLETIYQKLSEVDSYSVDLTCEVKGETFYKRFSFYPVDTEANFFILLKSDFTELQKRQTARNEQLKTALEEARQANIAKSAFLSNMSHEIRTPMNAIIGLNNIALNEEGLSQSTRSYLTQIGESARHLLGLINDILDMSRIESGRMVLKSEEFAFHNQIEQINTMIKGQCNERNQHYTCEIIGTIDEYYIGDSTKIKQILLNILGNAVKFTPDGGNIFFSIECINNYENKSTIKFIIQDSGIGMDKDYLPTIFEPFSQEEIGATSKYGGSGLGMAITKNIVEMMNGTIEVESEKNKGSIFTVCITLGNSNNTESSDNEKTEESLPENFDCLIVDDTLPRSEDKKRILDEAGIASETLSGNNALEEIKLRFARRKPYALILLDLDREKKEILETAKEIRRLAGEESIICILSLDTFENIQDSGVDSVIKKPLSAKSCRREFLHALQERRNKRSSIEALKSLEGRRVLLVEDVAINAKIMKHLLERLKIQVDLADNGKKALSKFTENPEFHYDAILMDIRMPVMDGLTATREIRALDKEDAKSVPIIALTANAFDEDVQHSLQAGMNAHLSKPVEPDILFETLRSFIQ